MGCAGITTCNYHMQGATKQGLQSVFRPSQQGSQYVFPALAASTKPSPADRLSQCTENVIVAADSGASCLSSSSLDVRSLKSHQNRCLPEAWQACTAFTGDLVGKESEVYINVRISMSPLLLHYFTIVKQYQYGIGSHGTYQHGQHE